MPFRFLWSDVFASQVLTSALSYTTSSDNRPFKLEEVSLHANIPISETVTITRVSKEGANYDTVKAKRTMVAEQDYVYRPSGEANFNAGDEVKVQCTYANGLGIVYVTIKRGEIK